VFLQEAQGNSVNRQNVSKITNTKDFLVLAQKLQHSPHDLLVKLGKDLPQLANETHISEDMIDQLRAQHQSTAKRFPFVIAYRLLSYPNIDLRLIKSPGATLSTHESYINALIDIENLAKVWDLKSLHDLAGKFRTLTDEIPDYIFVSTIATRVLGKDPRYTQLVNALCSNNQKEARRWIAFFSQTPEDRSTLNTLINLFEDRKLPIGEALKQSLPNLLPYLHELRRSLFTKSQEPSDTRFFEMIEDATSCQNWLESPMFRQAAKEFYAKDETHKEVFSEIITKFTHITGKPYQDIARALQQVVEDSINILL
jgi:hypothetical protein